MTRGVRTAWCVGAILGGSNALVHADQLGSTPAGLAAVVGERTVSLAELDALAADQLAKIRADEYAVRRRALDERVNRLLLEQEAARRGESLAEFLRTQVEAQVEPVTDEQARAVHEASPARAPGPPTTEDIARIAATLRQGRLAESRRRVVERLRQSARVRVLIEPPRVAIDTESGRGARREAEREERNDDEEADRESAGHGYLRLSNRTFDNSTSTEMRSPLPSGATHSVCAARRSTAPPGPST